MKQFEQKIFKNEVVAGAINSLVGSEAVVDHQFLHLTFPTKYFKNTNQRQKSQVNHQDSTNDPRITFEIFCVILGFVFYRFLKASG